MRRPIWLVVCAGFAGGACTNTLDDGLDAGSSDVTDAGSAGGPDAGAEPGVDAGEDGGEDAGPEPSPDAGPGENPDDLPDPILFVHGINGAAENFDAMIGRRIADGVPSERLFAYTFDDPSWGCNVDNASTIAAWVETILATTGADRIDLVAHSMGTLSTRHYMKFLGGTARVRTYATLGGQHQGLWQPCTAFLAPGDDENIPCVWDELCSTRAFIEALNAEPATPGDEVRWVSIFSTGDETVPASSSFLEGAENIELEGISHDGLLTEDLAYEALVGVLD